MLLLIAHMVMLAEYGQGGVAILHDGRMMADDNGRLIALAADQYLATAGGDVRALSLLAMTFWFDSFVDCWYPNYDAKLDG